MFEDAHHLPSIGEVNQNTVSSLRIYREVAVFTDQYFAKYNKLFLEYLKSRTSTLNTYILHHKALTFNDVEIDIRNDSMFDNSIVPIWDKSEVGGAILLYAISQERQRQYFEHLISMMHGTNVLTFRQGSEIAEFEPYRLCIEAKLKSVLEDLLTRATDKDAYSSLGLDMLTTWIDGKIIQRNTTNNPSTHAFNLLISLLWFQYFPALAIDNLHQLLYTIFTSMYHFAEKETSNFLNFLNMVLLLIRV